MLLLSPVDAASAIGASCGGRQPSPVDTSMLLILRWITPRVEAALNVESLTRQSFVDYFRLAGMPSLRASGGNHIESMLRLSNGFVLPGSVVVTAPSGEIVTGDASHFVNAKEGIVHMHEWHRGVYAVAYDSGFEVPPMPTPPNPLPDGYVAPDPENRVLLGVPDWIKAIAVQMLVVWYRAASLQPKMPENISFGQVSQLMERELYARVYETYMRPRAQVVFSDRLDRVA